MTSEPTIDMLPNVSRLHTWSLVAYIVGSVTWSFARSWLHIYAIILNCSLAMHEFNCLYYISFFLFSFFSFDLIWCDFICFRWSCHLWSVWRGVWVTWLNYPLLMNFLLVICTPCHLPLFRLLRKPLSTARYSKITLEMLGLQNN